MNIRHLLVCMSPLGNHNYDNRAFLAILSQIHSEGKRSGKFFDLIADWEPVCLVII
jgi:hypothetical protein